MKRASIFVLILLIFPLLSADSPGYSFEDNHTPLYLAVFIDGAEDVFASFNPGDQVNFTVRVFREERPLRPERIWVNLTVYNLADYEEIAALQLNVTEVEVGRYRGNVTIPEEWDETICEIVANVVDGPYSLEGWSAFTVGEGFLEKGFINMEFVSPIDYLSTLSPGDSFTLYLRAEKEGEAVDINPLTMETYVSVDAYPIDDEVPVDIELRFHRVERGLYSTVVTIPDDLATYGDFWISAMYYDMTSGNYGFASYYFTACPYPVWVNFLEGGEEGYTADVYVYDRTGRPLPGARVTAMDGSAEEATPERITDATGVARLTVPVGEDYPGEADLYLKVSYGGVVQYCSAYYLWYPGGTALPTSDGFEVWPANYTPSEDDDILLPLPAGTSSQTFRAFWGGEPLRGGTVITYLESSSDVLASYNSITDGEGLFTINLTLSEGEGYLLIFRAPVEGESWEEWPLFASASEGNHTSPTLEDLISEDIEVVRSSLYPGEKIAFSFRYSGTFSDDMAIIFDFIVGNISLNTSLWLYEGPGGVRLQYAYPGEIHVEREGMTSTRTTVELLIPYLPGELRGDEVTFIMGYAPMFSMMNPFADFDLQQFYEGIKLKVLTLPWEVGEGRVRGTVRNQTGSPVEGATVEIGGVRAVSDSDGTFSVNLTAGTYKVNVTAPGYIPWSGSVSVPTGAEATLEVTLVRLPPVWGNLTVRVVNEEGEPLEAQVELQDYGVAEGEGGLYTFTYIPFGTYVLEVTSTGYKDCLMTVELLPNSTLELEVVMEGIPSYPWGHLRVFVLEMGTREALKGARVTIRTEGYSATALTDNYGMAVFMYVPVGDYSVTVEMEGYLPGEASARVERWNPADVEVSLREALCEVYSGGVEKSGGEYLFYIFYRDEGGRPPGGIYVIVDGKEYPLSPEGDNYTEGVRYSVRVKLGEGRHSYYFRCVGPGGEGVNPADGTPYVETPGTVEVKRESSHLLPVLVAVVVVAAILIFLLWWRRRKTG